MSGLRPLPFRKVVKALEALGFRAVRQRGSHVIFRHPDGRMTVVPDHAREDIGRGLLRKILRDAAVDLEDFQAKL